MVLYECKKDSNEGVVNQILDENLLKEVKWCLLVSVG